jgi:hypothetical protein
MKESGLGVYLADAGGAEGLLSRVSGCIHHRLIGRRSHWIVRTHCRRPQRSMDSSSSGGILAVVSSTNGINQRVSIGICGALVKKKSAPAHKKERRSGCKTRSTIAPLRAERVEYRLNK